MKAILVDIELVDPVSVSATGATLGVHECLDFLLGSLFWGVAAGYLYRDLKTREMAAGMNAAHLVFHSGKVRFGCARPLGADGAEYLPVPLAWHVAKGLPEHENGRYAAAAIVNLARTRWTEGQARQVRDAWVAPDGRRNVASHRMDLRSATDKRGFDSALDSALFGITALCAGSRHRFSVECDEDVPSDLRQAVFACFREGAVIRIGRSRSTEYGRARIVSVAEQQLAAGPPGPATPAGGGSIVLMALTDLCLADGNGQPVLVPSPEHFLTEVPDGCVLEPSRTFLRTRSWAPFNHFRNVFGLERQVLVKGSVIVFTLPQGASIPGNAWRTAAGLWTAEGLGRFAVEPSLLAAEAPHFVPPSAAASATPVHTAAAPPMPKGPLAEALLRRHSTIVIRQLAVETGLIWAQQWLGAERARRIRRSQWAAVREAAASASDRDSLLSGLRKVFAHGSARRVWKVPHSSRSPDEIILQSLAPAPLAKALAAAGAPSGPVEASALAIAACREAAIAVSRKLSAHDDR